MLIDKENKFLKIVAILLTRHSPALYDFLFNLLTVLKKISRKRNLTFIGFLFFCCFLGKASLSPLQLYDCLHLIPCDGYNRYHLVIVTT